MPLSDLDKKAIKSRFARLLNYFVDAKAQEFYFHHRNIALPFILKLRTEKNTDFIPWFTANGQGLGGFFQRFGYRMPTNHKGQASTGALQERKAFKRFAEAAAELNAYYHTPAEAEKAAWVDELIVEEREEFTREREKLKDDFSLQNGEVIKRQELLVEFNRLFPTTLFQPQPLSSTKQSLQQFKAKAHASVQEYFEQAQSSVKVPELSYEKAAVADFKKALESLQKKVRAELKAGRINQADALDLAKASFALAESVADGTVSIEGSIKSFAAKTKPFESSRGWGALLYAILAAAIALVLVTCLVLMATPLAAGAALLSGDPTTCLTAACSTAGGFILGGSFGLWKGSTPDPLKQMAASAKEIVARMDCETRQPGIVPPPKAA